MNEIKQLSFLAQQQPTFQMNRYDLTVNDDLLFSMENISGHLLENKFKSEEDLRKQQLSDLTYTIAFGLICACLCFLTITGNLLVLVTFRRVRTVGNLFILSLATADLIVGCFVMPLAGIYAIMEDWKMGLGLCRIWISVDFTASTASIFNLLTLSLDRYWSITSPLQYLGKRTRTRALLLIGVAWGLSLLWVIPIFGWKHFVKDNNLNKDRKHDDSNIKCEPEYSHSIVFKVTTAILNFYLPLLVLIGLNARIYYEIKRRYKNVLFQRHSNKIRESLTTQNSNSFYGRQRKYPGKNNPLPVTMTLCDSDRQACSTTINYTENDSLLLPKISLKSPENDSILRVNFKERKNRITVPIRNPEKRHNPIKRTYSFGERNLCTQDGITWLTHPRAHSHAAYSQPSSPVLSNYPSHRLCVNDHCYKNTNDYQSSQIYCHQSKLTHNCVYSHHRYDTSATSRYCSVFDTEQISSSIPCVSSSAAAASTRMNIFNLCHCCSAASSDVTIHSNSFANNNQTNSTIESYVQKRPASTSSTSSIVPSVINLTQYRCVVASRNRTGKSPPTSSFTRSRSSNKSFRTNPKLKQSTIWNQQEKAFRQLFAIVFGFTCCFLPYFILYMVVAYCNDCISERALTASIWLGYVNSTINPFLYALSNKHFRRTFHRLFRRNNHQQSFYN